MPPKIKDSPRRMPFETDLLYPRIFSRRYVLVQSGLNLCGAQIQCEPDVHSRYGPVLLMRGFVRICYYHILLVVQ
jgi:hypothetical protein